jgi:hypothetical protein
VSKQLAHGQMKTWRRDAVAFVLDNFHVELDPWQLEVLRALPVTPKLAMSACKGPGKSAVLAWCGWWIMSCHEDAQGVATSITSDNLRDNLWKELAVWWQQSPWLMSAFTVNAERIASRERPKTWWLSARSFAQDADKTAQANTLAGLHARIVFALLDEVGDYPQGVVVAAEGIFADKTAEGAWLLAAGNPTSVDGPLFNIVTNEPHLWKIVSITGDPEDPKRSTRISIKWAQEHIDKWGRDNAWVRVNVLGLFPLVGSNKLLGPEEVAKAQRRDIPALHYIPDARVWGVDPARFGDDEAALAKRQGLLCRRIKTWRGLDGPQLAAEIAQELLDAEKSAQTPDAIFVDVGGNGSSCYDHLRLLGWGDIIFPVEFGSKPRDARFADKRSEMWWDMAEWVKKREACLPNDPDLQEQLLKPTLDFVLRNKRAVLALMSKEKMKQLGMSSPDKADALCLTFAQPVMPLTREARPTQQRSGRCVTEYQDYSR